jgi:hypothetical protein
MGLRKLLNEELHNLHSSMNYYSDEMKENELDLMYAWEGKEVTHFGQKT